MCTRYSYLKFQKKYYTKYFQNFLFPNFVFPKFFLKKRFFYGSIFWFCCSIIIFDQNLFYCCWDKIDVRGPLYTCLVYLPSITLHFESIGMCLKFMISSNAYVCSCRMFLSRSYFYLLSCESLRLTRNLRFASSLLYLGCSLCSATHQLEFFHHNDVIQIIRLPTIHYKPSSIIF